MPHSSTDLEIAQVCRIKVLDLDTSRLIGKYFSFVEYMKLLFEGQKKEKPLFQTVSHRLTKKKQNKPFFLMSCFVELL